MKAALTAWLERRWYGGVPPGPLLRLLERLYAREVVRRRRAYVQGRRTPEQSSLPVVIVGNLTAGGAGKTPLVIALVEELRKRGWKPGVISRGYGGSGVLAARVQADSNPDAVGDEPLLIVQRTGAPVVAAARRIQAARLLEATGEVDVLIGDDGLQHYALARDLEILVIDGVRRFGNARLLPAGPLREPPERALTVDYRVANGGQAQAGEVAMQLELGDAVSLDGRETVPLSRFVGSAVDAVAGIGYPQRFFDSLHAQGIEAVPHAFPDHHRFRAADLQFGHARALLMTEKDAVKCRGFPLKSAYFVPIEARLPAAFFDAIDACLKSRTQEKT